MYRLVASESFLRQARKFFRRHPDLKPRYREVLEALSSDPFDRRLGLHPLKGDLAGLHAVRLTYKYRITLILEIRAKEIVLLDIGSHEDVYG